MTLFKFVVWSFSLLGFNQSFTPYVCLAKYEGNGLSINENDNVEVFDDSESGECLAITA